MRRYRRIGMEIQRAKNEEELNKIYEALTIKGYRKNWKYYEPNELEEIEKLTRRLNIKEHFSYDSLKNKIAGARIGRIVGNMLGKPVEWWKREEIISYLKKAKALPLDNYIPGLIPKDEKIHKYYYERGTRGKINCALRDDGIDYTILNLELVEERGFNFSTEEVGKFWMNKLPYAKTYTAEREAYRNLILGLKPPETATFWNPFREWIGAQIRADIFGYLNSSDPLEASRLAYKDARLSHTKNGIYGEMFIAATIASSFVSNSTLEAIEFGKNFIPSTSRLYETIEDCIRLWKDGKEFEEAYTRLMEKYGKYNQVNTISNEVIVILSLLYGENDFTKTITLAVTSGLDTDCNCATVGSIVGAILGEEKIEGR